MSTSMPHPFSSSEHISSGYSSAQSPIPAPDYLMPVSTETMVNGQHCNNKLKIWFSKEILKLCGFKRFYRILLWDFGNFFGDKLFQDWYLKRCWTFITKFKKGYRWLRIVWSQNSQLASKQTGWIKARTDLSQQTTQEHKSKTGGLL